MKKNLYLAGILLAVSLGGIAQTISHTFDKDIKGSTHTWLVDASSQQTGNYIFNDMRAALSAADSIQRTLPKGTFSEEHPLTIYIAPSVYWLDNPDDPTIRKPLPGEGIPYGMKLKLDHVRLIGLGKEPSHTILASNRGQTQGAVGNFTMLHLTGEDILFENLTLGNYCNVDLVYEPDTSLNRPRRADAIVQAQLAICQGDRIAAKRCRFISRLNTCPLVGARRTYFEECYFECTDDALCGTGIHYQCSFTLFSGKPFYSTQGTGAVFIDCDLHSLTDGKQYLVKSGSPVSMMDCRWTMNQGTSLRWTQDPTDDQRSYQYNVTKNGQPVLIDEERPHLTVEMAGKRLLDAYRLTLPKEMFRPQATGDTVVYNLFNLTKGKDGWNPANQPVEVMEGYTGKAVAMTLNHRRATIETGKEALHLKASTQGFMQRPDFTQNRQGVRWLVNGKNPSCVELKQLADGSLQVIPANQGEEAERICITATDSTGLQAACVIDVKPQQLPAPVFTAQPVISRKGETLKINYALDLHGRRDESVITWYRSTTADGKDAVAVAVNRADKPIEERRTYVLTAADHGKYIRATVTPKHLRSPYGAPCQTAFKKKIRTEEKGISQYWTDFANFPTERQPQIIAGHWTVDAYKPTDTRGHEWEADTIHPSWTYGYGVDGAALRKGLIQRVKGARLRYTPLPGEYHGMEVKLHVSPCKTAGQGFGSATGQYMDIYIKMDTRTLTGYALRIIRTTKNDKAVDFQLMRYDNGVVTPISKAVSAICYRTGCVIHMQATEQTLTAHVSNTNPLPSPHREGLAKEVHLTAPITPSTFGGTGIQHTGSVGASATVIESMQITWD